jgi:phosphorylated CTD-interacting factor 1
MQRYRGATGYRPNEGSGHHCATPPEVLNALRDNIGVQMECFASPFNSHFFHFCTAFGDTDVFFGSLGSFFSFRPVEGSFEVGPPFVEELMEAMRVHIEALVAASARPLSFAIIIPEWTDPITPCIAKIYENKTGSLRRKIVVPKEAHVYHDGFQHTLRDTLFKPVHNTLVLVLQNDAGSRKWPVSDEVERKILAPWAACAEGVRENPLLALKRQREE